MPTSQLPLLAWKSRKKITHLPLPHWYSTAVEERLNCFTILYFHFPHLTSSSAILIFSMCTRRWFNILPRIWSPIIPQPRSSISSCHFTSKEGQVPWCIHLHHAARLKLWKSFFPCPILYLERLIEAKLIILTIVIDCKIVGFFFLLRFGPAWRVSHA